MTMLPASRAKTLVIEDTGVDKSHRKQSQILILASAFLMLFAVVSADIQVGAQYGVLLFYFIPIAWTAWLAGNIPAIIIAIFCSLSRIAVKVDEVSHTYESSPEVVWNISTELIFFLVFVGLLLKLQQQFELERSLARTDGLTKLYNARAFEVAVTGERERLRRYGRIMSLVYLDLDNFKAVNDRWGHAAGDDLLITIARTMSGNIRQVDVAARLGGDEFALLLPETGKEGAEIVVNRLREKMLAAVQARGWPVTCSIGCVTFEAAPESVEAMLKETDAAMYISKKTGKNKIEMAVWNLQE
jgi:diguanylate cyclase (GGDEF)-like protein